MPRTRGKTMVVATLLLAALSSYVDLPRLNVVLHAGDALNAARVFDVSQQVRMLQRLADAGDGNSAALRTQFDDGMHTLNLIGSSSLLRAIAPPLFQLPALIGDEDSGRVTLGEVGVVQPLAALPGAFLKLDLPPPRFESLLPLPRMQLPTGNLFSHSARAPPLALR